MYNKGGAKLSGVSHNRCFAKFGPVSILAVAIFGPQSAMDLLLLLHANIQRDEGLQLAQTGLKYTQKDCSDRHEDHVRTLILLPLQVRCATLLCDIYRWFCCWVYSTSLTLEAQPLREIAVGFERDSASDSLSLLGETLTTPDKICRLLQMPPLEIPLLVYRCSSLDYNREESETNCEIDWWSEGIFATK